MSPAIDPTSDRPAYRQIADHLRTAMARGELAAGAQLPSEQRLVDSYGAARGTVRQAIAELKAEGLVVVEQGRGAFVRPKPAIRRLSSDRFARRHRRAGRAAFLAETEAAGSAPTVEVIHVGSDEASPEMARRLNIPAGARVLVRRRRYLADGVPMELATSYVPWTLAEGTAMVEENPGPGGIYARLEETGHRLARFTEEVAARLPSPEEARALGLPPGVPVFDLLRTAYDGAGSPVEVCDTVMAADRYVLSYELPAR